MRPLLVGESNPYSDDPEFSLYPFPRGAAGSRLCNILGMTSTEYLMKFDRVNLMPDRGKWDLKAARARAIELPHTRRVLLGSRVCQAHLIQFDVFEPYHFKDGQALVFPHPSGRCRIWNDRTNIERARAALKEFLGG